MFFISVSSADTTFIEDNDFKGGRKVRDKMSDKDFVD